MGMIVPMQPLMVIIRHSAFCISLRKISSSRKALSTNSRSVSSLVPGIFRYASARLRGPRPRRPCRPRPP